MQRALDFDKTPALGVPLPFLLNVPLFGLLAGLLATWFGPVAFGSRWSAQALALTHLWTLGILGSAMLGALLQILAVACNVPTPGIRLLARWVHPLLTVGTLLLAAGFLWWWPTAWISAVIFLASAFLAYLITVAAGLWQHRQQVYPGAREILVPVRGALVSLALTVFFGASLASALGLGTTLPNWLGSHVLWGLAGWGGLLVMGMTFQLLPIFQVTEIYPKAMTRWLPLLIPILLLSWTAVSASTDLPPLMRETVELILVASYALWAATTWQRLFTRKRPAPEATTLFWYLSMGCLLASAPLWIWMTHGQNQQAASVLGVAIIVGTLGGAVNGMLYKIIPFLLWKHAQDSISGPNRDPAMARIYLKVLPKMATYISEPAARTQWAAYSIMTLCWLLAAAGWRAAQWAAGPLLLVSSGLLLYNVGRALWRYRRALQAVARVAAAHQPR